MGLVLLNLKTKQQIELDVDKPLIIGRKNIFECEDKRVSRSHGKIMYTQDGKVILSALHHNPCFFTRKGVPPVVPLNKDEEETLSVGDCLGLLPDSFWFQITSKENCEKLNFNKSSEINKLNNYMDNNKSVDKVDDNDLNQAKNVSALEKECKTLEATPSVFDTTAEPGASNSKTPSWGYGSAEFEKTRRLPLWMYQIDEPISSKNDSPKTSAPSSSKLEQPKPKKLKTHTDSECDFDKPSTSALKRDGHPSSMNHFERCNDNHVSTSFHVNDSDKLQTGASKLNDESNGAMSKDGYESDVEPEPGTTRRPICCYENECYRKNEQHKLDFCHPGDADYVAYENRPMCKYGSSCYRRNRLHRVEFRHPTDSAINDQVDDSNDKDSHRLSCSPSPGEERPPCFSGSDCNNSNRRHRKEFYHPPKGYVCHFTRKPDTKSSPLPAKRKRKPVIRQGVNSGDDDLDLSDGYDLEDPFINDASSDEYVPGNTDIDQESDYFDD